MKENASIKVIPFLGGSKNLMEHFFIIGYKENILLEYAQEQNIEKINEFQLSIISSISSYRPFESFNVKEIIKQVYPDNPNIIEKIKQDPPNPSSIITFSSFDILGGKEKVFYACYALKFYEIFIEYKSKREYYIPKAFVILSQYPYFSSFHKICLNLYENSIEQKIKPKKLKENELYISDNIPIELFIYSLLNYIPSPYNNNIQTKIFKKDEYNISLPKLRGYPYADFDLFKAINTMSINDYIKIYISVLLEINLVFFSQDIETLNMVMFSFFIFNYPLVDTYYFWYILSRSKNDLKKRINIYNKYFIGINENYSKQLDISKFEELYFIIDMQNEKKIRALKAKNAEAKEMRKVIEYIKSILEKKNFKPNNLLSEYVLSLKNNLINLQNDYLRKFENNKSIFTMNNDINEMNKKLQLAFYEFNLNILSIVYKNYIFDDNSTIITFKDNNLTLSKEEKLFFKYFKCSYKYLFYFNNFIKKFKTFDEFRVPLLFLDEFVTLKVNKNNIKEKFDQFKINYLDIMDAFYSSSPKDNVVSYSDLFQDFRAEENIKTISKIIKAKKGQLFYLDKELIDFFLFNKKNRANAFQSLKAKKNPDNIIESSEKSSLLNTIKINSFNILNQSYFIRSSLVYIFSIIFPLHPFGTCTIYLDFLLSNIAKINCFQRFYVYLLLKSIKKYYIINQEKKYFRDLTSIYIQNYYDKIKKFLNKYTFVKNGQEISISTIPNEEIMSILRKRFLNRNDSNNNENENNFVFEYDKVGNYVKKINYDIITIEGNKLTVKYQGKDLEYKFLTPDYLFQIILYMYDDFDKKHDFDIKYLEFENIIEIVINLLFYFLSSSYNELDISLFLFRTLIAIKKLQKDLNINVNVTDDGNKKDNEPINDKITNEAQNDNNNIINQDNKNKIIEA